MSRMSSINQTHVGAFNPSIEEGDPPAPDLCPFASACCHPEAARRGQLKDLNANYGDRLTQEGNPIWLSKLKSL
jgi:hypothetical protein